MKNWKILVDPSTAKKEGSKLISFMDHGKLVKVRVFFDRKDMSIYVEAPVKKPAVRARLLKLADRS